MHAKFLEEFSSMRWGTVNLRRTCKVRDFQHFGGLVSRQRELFATPKVSTTQNRYRTTWVKICRAFARTHAARAGGLNTARNSFHTFSGKSDKLVFSLDSAFSFDERVDLALPVGVIDYCEFFGGVASPVASRHREFYGGS